jgi:hypothetical protein
MEEGRSMVTTNNSDRAGRRVIDKSKLDAPIRRQAGPSDARIREMIGEATVDAYDESEQTVGFYTMLENHLTTPFKTEVLGVEVTVERIEMTDDEQIIAVCARGRSRQRISILELPLPTTPPKGADWIVAFRRWAQGVR